MLALDEEGGRKEKGWRGRTGERDRESFNAPTCTCIQLYSVRSIQKNVSTINAQLRHEYILELVVYCEWIGPVTYTMPKDHSK